MASDSDKFVFTLRGGLKMPALGLGTYAPKEVQSFPCFFFLNVSACIVPFEDLLKHFA